MFWLLLLLFVSTTVVSALLNRKSGLKASGLGDFTAPTADATRVIPVVWGTVKLTGPNTLWYGDLKTKAIKAGGLLGFGSQTIGYKYYLGMELGCCHGQLDDVLALYMGPAPNDKFVPFASKTLVGGHYRITIDQKNLFGGDKREGGISGDIDFYLGTPTQAANDYMTNQMSYVGAGGVAFVPTYSGVGNGQLTKLHVTSTTQLETITVAFVGITHFTVSGTISGALGSGTTGNTFICSVCSFKIIQGSSAFAPGDRIQFNTAPMSAGGAPAYPLFSYFVLRQMYLGTSNYLKALSPVVRRCPNPLGLSPSNANLGGDANYANVVYEIMTNTIWGQGRPASLFDTASFIAAGNQLAAEGLGCSLTLDNPAQTDTLLNEIMAHIDGALYTDPATGLWTLKLARNDYDPATLLSFDPSSIIGKPQFVRPSWEETINQIIVTYIDRAQNYTAQQVKADESANFATTGVILRSKIDLKGFSNATAAQFAAMRELKQHSYPLGQLKVMVNRTGWNLRIGQCFKFSWPLLGISNLICRATQINYGTLEKGQIEVTAVEDIFNVAFAAYTPPNPTLWTNPASAAALPPLAELAIEGPYHITGDQRLVLVGAVRGDASSLGVQVWADPGSGYAQINDFQAFCPYGVLLNDYLHTGAVSDSVGFIVTGGVDLDDVVSTDAPGRAAGNMLVVIDGEILAAETITDNLDGTMTVSAVWRGAMDTLPADHFAGASVFFITDSIASAYTSALTADIISRNFKLLPYNPLGVVPIASVSAVAVTTTTRYPKPYPPGKAQINGVYYPAQITNDAALSWAHRNRVNQRSSNVLVAQDDAGTGVTPEGNYTIDVLLNGVVIHTFAALTGTAQTYTALQRFLDDTDGTKTVQFRITPINGALIGTVRLMDAFLMTGFGLSAGQGFGGQNA